MHSALAQFQSFFAHYGLAAVFVLLLLENFGLPLPGEVALLYAGYQMRVDGRFGLPALIATASAGSFAGQCVGYAAGCWAAGWLQHLFAWAPKRVDEAKRYFAKHGPLTIVFSRFMAGLRVLAGPLAGLGHMPLRRFLVFNAVGALAWVTALASLGWFVGAQWRSLIHIVGRVDIAIAAVAVVAILYLWHRHQN